MRIVVTGASGFVGRSLVPYLIRADVELLLVGRRPEELARLFPGCAACSYAELESRAAGWDQLVHLAVVNSDSKGDAREFERGNVDLLMQVATTAKRIGIGRLVNVSSVHALDEHNQSPYAASKRRAAQMLAALPDLNAVTVYLPLVHGECWAGRLAWLNRLPRALARPVFGLAAAFRPTVHVQQLAGFVLSASTRSTSAETSSSLGSDDCTEIVLSDRQVQNSWYAGLKRGMDIVVAITLLALFWWVLLLLWVAVRLTSPGAGILAQPRIGKNGREFVSYKFRTMKTGTPQAATHEIPSSAVTPLGAFLRRTKLDELPQAINVLRGEMSLIGPRPCLPSQTELIEARRRLGVLDIKPGISGLAQINGVDMSTPLRLARWDARYIALRSLSLDVRIALSTVGGRGRGDRVRT